MKTPVHTFKRTALAVAVTLMTAPAWAVPTLQLDIAGGTYNVADQSIFASSNTFSLYAYGLASGPKPVDLLDKFFISMALVPQTTTPGSYGSFVVDGITVNVTSDMIAGGPPLDITFEATTNFDAHDLAKHGVFPTFFTERGFFFSAADQSAVYNTQDVAGSGPQLGEGMYYKKFDFDISGLAPGLGIHFDLYNIELINRCKGKTCTVTDIDVDEFAPFSHDAAGYVTTPIPEPETYAMLLAGLGLMGLVARRRKNRPF